MADEEKIKLENKIAFLENTVTIMQQRLKSLGKKYSEDLEKENGELLKILQLQKENAELRARLDKAVELPRIIHPNKNEWFVQYEMESGLLDDFIFYSKESAEERLAELKGGKK